MKLRRSCLWIFTTCALASVASAEPASKYVEVLGQRIHYVEAGAGPTLILVHGLGADTGVWRATVPALAVKHRVLALDEIGFGQSDKPLMNYRIATLVEFLRGFCAKVGVERATFVGNSLGGWTVAAFTLAHPDLVERLVLVDAAGFSPARLGGPPYTREQLLGLNPATQAEFRTLMSRVFFHQGILTDAFIEEGFANKLRKNDGYTVNQFIEVLLRGDEMLDGKLGALKAPTLVVWGREDGLTPVALAGAFLKDIPGAKSAILEKCGHTPQLECAPAFNAALLDFVDGPAAAR